MLESTTKMKKCDIGAIQMQIPIFTSAKSP
jgi:hypothetical protein